MPFIDKSKSNYSFKVLQGKAHTANDRELSNESIASGLILSSSRIFANNINKNPNSPTNTGIVSEQVTLTIKPIAGSDGANLGTWTGYRCYLEGLMPTSLSGVINPLTGVSYVIGDVVGNIIPQSFGISFRPILYSDSNATVEIPPSDASDWFLDPYAGVVVQEADAPLSMFKTSITLSGPHNGRLKAYIYIGEYVIDKLVTPSGSSIITNTDWINSVIATSSIVPTTPIIGQRYLLDSTTVGLTFSEYDINLDITNTFVSSGWEAIEYYTGIGGSGWIVTSPTTAMSVSIETDQNAIYQYYSGLYNRKSFEQTYPTVDNKYMSCNITTNDGDEAITTPIIHTPSEGAYVEFSLNGLQVRIEDSATVGSLVTAPCYFSGDFGATHSSRVVKLIKNIKAGDKLYWMGSIAGYELDISDIGDFNYVIITAP